MSLRVNSDLNALKHQRNVNQNMSTLGLTMRRLSEGLRVGRASDDAAGLSISERMSAQARGATQSVRNITTGASLVQVIDGALAETEAALQRVRELSVQAASEQLSREDRDAIHVEVQQLIQHIDAISEQTHFNGRHVLNGEYKSITFHVGASEGEAYELALHKANSESLGRQARYQAERRGGFVGDLQTGEVTINGVAIRGTVEADDLTSYSYASGSAIAKAAAINHSTEWSGVRAIVEATEVRSFEPVQALSLTHQDFLKINGFGITGVEIENKDATGSLVEAINRGHSETGVVATTDAEGHLILIAEDGRNITIEYGGSAVRDALRVIDAYGDPINLVNTIDPVQVQLDGDVEDVSFAMNGGGNYDGQFSITGDALINNALVADNTGGYTRPRDNVDYVLEVVDPGGVGTATFRYKEESVADYTVDPSAESYLFNAEGVVTAPSSKLSVQGVTHYNEASSRTYRLYVTKGGLSSASAVADLPEYYYTVTNNDTGVLEFTSGTIVADQGNPETLLHNVVIDYPTTTKRAYNSQTSNTFLTSNNMSGSDAAGDDYTTNNGRPRFLSWTGDRTTLFDFEVVRAGHVSSSAVIAGSNTPAAQVRVVAQEINTGVITSQTYTLSAGQDITHAGMRFDFVGQNGVINSATDTSSSYSGSATSGGVFVGTQDYTYMVRAEEDGVVTGSSAVDGRVYIYDQGGALIDSSQVIQIKSGSTFNLGTGAHFEGVQLRFSNSTTSKDLLRTGGNYTGSVNLTGTYTGVTDEVNTFTITQAGRVGQSALYEYRDSSNALISSGVVNTSNALGDGVTLNLSKPAPSMSALNHTINGGGTPVSTSRNVSGYTEEQGASVVFDVLDDGSGGQNLQASWTFADSSTSTQTVALTTGSSLNVGHGVTVQINDPVQTGDRFTSNVSVEALEVGDAYRVTLNSGMIKTNDAFTVTTGARDLALGTTWEARGEVPEWLVGDVYQVNASHNFVNTKSTLTSAINLPGMGTVNLTGAGTFETGDEIRVRTRGYTGGATSSGFYTDNLYPTDYVVTITKEGPIGTAEYSWVRADGRQDLTQIPPIVGSGTGVTSTGSQLIEAGVNIAFTENATSNAHLNVGDVFRIPVGQKLEYTFAGTLTLQSEENIEVDYTNNDIDNQLGRMLYVGDLEAVNTAGTLGNLSSGILGANTATSLNDVHLDSQRDAEVAMDIVDLALLQVGRMRTDAGAALNHLETRAAVMRDAAYQADVSRSRIRDADVAAESAALARSQVIQSLTPSLAQAIQLSKGRALELLNLTLR